MYRIPVLDTLPRDKLAHCLGGVILYVVLAVPLSPIPALLAATLLAAHKEMTDFALPTRHCSFMDFLWSTIGSTAGFVSYVVSCRVPCNPL